MTLSDYSLLAQLGSGADGVAYRATTPGEEQVMELRVLSGVAADPVRRDLLFRRLGRVQLLQHPGSLRVREMALAHDPPWLALEWAGRAAEPDPLRWAVELCRVLHAAHRVGLTHGGLCREAVRVTEAGHLKLDFTGLDTGSTAPCSLSASPEDDIAALGRLFQELPGEWDAPFAELLARMQAADPTERPGLGEVEAVLTPALSRPTLPASDLAATRFVEVDLPPRQQLGRFRLTRKLGEGGMGEVYLAEDQADGTLVAVKVLRRDWTDRPAALKRLHKEARLLAEVKNPHVANLIEVNEDAGVHFLALEYVPGPSLRSLLAERKALGESLALVILADLCRGLIDAHARGIVHRDIKPENVLLPGLASGTATAEQATPAPGEPFARLTDFGLAKQVAETESMHLTKTGQIVGTPYYLSPEQCRSGTEVGPPSDIYSLGVTLFEMLAGRPPFQADTALELMTRHDREPPPELRSLVADASDGVCRLVAQMLAKPPGHRPADAAALLLEVERLRRGEPSAVEVHPRLPECDPQRVLTYAYEWELASPPERLWPLVSNTERVNRAIGLASVNFKVEITPEGQVRRNAQVQRMGLEVNWVEHPFEWLEGRRFGVLRECSSGPFRWLVSLVEMRPRPGGGTKLTHTIRVEPNGVFGRTFAALQLGLQVRRSLARVYRRIDASLTGEASPALVDPFEEPPRLTAAQRARLDQGLDRLVARGVATAVAERLVDYLATAAPQEAARIRPLALARKLGLEVNDLVTACLHAAHEGLLVLLWDLLCPICRRASEVKDTLRAVREHGRCEPCNNDFPLDFAHSVEMIFRAHPAVREVETATYCVGGPAHAPHVVAQVRLAAGERLELELALAEGAYRVRGPQLPVPIEFRVRPDVGQVRWELDLARGVAASRGLPVLRAGAQRVVLNGMSGQGMLVRIERAAMRDDALTAARASALALFRQLFPQELLSPGQLMSVANVTLLATDLDGTEPPLEALDEASAFALLHAHLGTVEALVRAQGGAVVKALPEGVLAVFHEPVAAVRAVLALAGTERLRAAVHRGPSLAATLNDQLDYFGATVRQTLRLARLGAAGERLLSQAVMDDPDVAGLLRQAGRQPELFRADLPGQAQAIVYRVASAPV